MAVFIIKIKILGKLLSFTWTCVKLKQNATKWVAVSFTYLTVFEYENKTLGYVMLEVH